jgi:hypothetical protein
MMDLSDGLAKDLPALTPRGAEAALYAPVLPLRAGASLREALCDGEDYELAFGVASAAARPSSRRRGAGPSRAPGSPASGGLSARGRSPPTRSR